MGSMISAVARSKESINLLEFADSNGLHDDWSSSHDEKGIRAMITGMVLDNKNSPSPISKGSVNTEFLVHLTGPAGKCVVNLSTVLALASAYIRDDLQRVSKLTGKGQEK